MGLGPNKGSNSQPKINFADATYSNKAFKAVIVTIHAVTT